MLVLLGLLCRGLGVKLCFEIELGLFLVHVRNLLRREGDKSSNNGNTEVGKGESPQRKNKVE